MKSEKVIRGLAVATVLIAAVYVVISIYRSSSSTYKTTTAYVQTVSETVDANMYIVRQEQVLTTDTGGGVVVSLVQNGDKVSNGSEIAAIFGSEKDAENYSDALALQKKLETYEKIDSQVRLANLDMDKLNNDIDRDFRSMLDAVYYNSYGTLSEDELAFSENFSRKSISLGYDVDCSEQITALKKQIKKLTAVKPKDIITASAAGYFVSRPDGYEKLLTVDGIDSLTANQLKKALKADKGKVSAKAIGKIVNGFDWYAACIVPIENMTDTDVGSKLGLILGSSEQETVSARVYRKETLEDGNCLVILRCSNINSDLIGLRKITGKIVIKSHTGIKIPKDAVRFNDDNQVGVYIREGNLIKFNRISEIYSNDNFVVAEDKSGSAGWLAQYDEIVISGKELSNGKVIE